MTIETSIAGDKEIITLTGRLDTITAPQLEAVVNDAPENIQLLELDFSALEYLSSAGLRVLLKAHKMMHKRRGDMVIRHVNEVIADVFEVTGFVDILTIE